MRLERGQTAVVTGAASGIGRALVRNLAARGVTVVAADIEKSSLDDLVREGSAALGVGLDVRNLDEVQALADESTARYGHVDLLVNNAGVFGHRAFTWEQEPHDWRWMVDVNYLGVLNGVRAFVPHMIATGRGHVVNTGSVTGIALLGVGIAPYAASKHAVVGLTEWLAHELASVAPEIRATVACPGPVTTRIKEAERNRQSDYAATPRKTTPIDPGLMHGLPSISAEQAAAELVAGIEADVLYLPIGPGVADAARERLRRVADDLDRVVALDKSW